MITPTLYFVRRRKAVFRLRTFASCTFQRETLSCYISFYDDVPGQFNDRFDYDGDSTVYPVGMCVNKNTTTHSIHFFLSVCLRAPE